MKNGIKIAVLFIHASFFFAQTSVAYDTLVLAHYMGWYSDSADGYRHWKDGFADTPSIGMYNSQSNSLLTYHTLLALKCGINGFVINCNDTVDNYDFQTALQLSRVIKYWHSIDSVNYHFTFAVSYDDQSRMNSLGANMRFIRDSLIAGFTQYLRVEQKPVIYNYPGHVTAQNFRATADTVFGSDALLAWNESDSSVFRYVDACYSWVQPNAGQWDTVNGLEWGSEYINGHIWRMDNWPQSIPDSRIKFGINGVWPGFDDRSCSWSNNRFIARQNGAVYDSTWLKCIEYKKQISFPWVYLETWNDFNEGTEIEPTKEYGYHYLLTTIKNINTFKNTLISSDTIAFFCAKRIYTAHAMIETGKRDSVQNQPRLVAAVKSYLKDDYQKVGKLTDTIIDDIVLVKNQVTIVKTYEDVKIVYFHENEMQIKVKNSKAITIRLFDLRGRCLYASDLKADGAGMCKVKLTGIKRGVVLLKICNWDQWSMERTVVVK